MIRGEKMNDFKTSAFEEAENYEHKRKALTDEPYWESLGRDNQLKVRQLQSEFEIYDREEIAYEFVKSGFSLDMTRDTLTRRMLKEFMEEVHHGM